MTYDPSHEIGVLLTGIARALRDESGAVSEIAGRLAEASRQQRARLTQIEQENGELRAEIAELRAALASRTTDVTDTE